MPRSRFAHFALVPLVFSAALVGQNRVHELVYGRILAREEADEKLQNAVNLGLAWLAAHQDDDGSWDPERFMKHDADGVPTNGRGQAVHRVGLTALATLALLADGQHPGEGGGRFGSNVTRALDWLAARSKRDRLAKKHGENWLTKAPARARAGFLGNPASHTSIYGHLIATQALLEGHLMTGEPLYRDVGIEALAYSERARNPYSAWRYQPRDNDNDSSVTTWATHAVFLGQFVGVPPSRNVLPLVGAWYDQMTDPTNGRVGYTEKGGRSGRSSGEHHERFPVELSEVCTSLSLFANRLFPGYQSRSEALTKMQIELMTDCRTEWNAANGSIDLYFWNFASLALAAHRDTKPAQKWLNNLRACILGAQRDDGNFAGSWDPVGAWGDEGGRVMSTAFCVLTILAETRYPDLTLLTPFRGGRIFNIARRRWRTGELDEVLVSLAKIDTEALQPFELEDIAFVRAKIESAAKAAAARLDAIVADDSLKPLDVALELDMIAAAFSKSGPGARAKALLAPLARERFIREELNAQRGVRKALSRRDTMSASGFDKEIVRVRSKSSRGGAGGNRLLPHYPWQ